MTGIIVYLIFFHLPILIQSADFDTNDYEQYGPTLAANDHLIVAIQNRMGVFSVISNYSGSTPSYCTVNYTAFSSVGFYATMVAVGRNGLATTNINKFAFIAYVNTNTLIYLIVVNMTFPTCQTSFTQIRITNQSYPSYSALGVDSNGILAFYITDSNKYIANLASSSPMTAVPWSLTGGTIIVPEAIDLRDTWGVFAAHLYSNTGVNKKNPKFKPTLYNINFTNCLSYVNSSCFTLAATSFQWQTDYLYTWQSSKAPPSTVIDDDYNSLFDISVSISDQGYILVGIQSMDTVFCLSSSFQSYGSRLPSTIPSIGFGRSVGWLDNTTAMSLLNNFTYDYAQWRSSNIELYPMNSSKSLSNTISAYASFPNAHQQLWSQLNTRLINTLAIPGSGSLILMDYVGNVYVIRPSLAGSFAYTENGIGNTGNTIYVAPTLRCPSGTLKNQSASGKDIFRYCVLCAEGTFYSANRSNQTNQCIPCDSTLYFCPWGSVAQLPLSVLDTISQAQVYPESPDNDVFEDILLLNMFSVDFSPQCLTKQPLFYGIIIIGIGCLFLLFMGILKLTGKLKKQRRMMKNIFKQTDLIGEGELWIGGVISFAVVVIAIFAYRFSKSFLYQYPIESVGNATFACDPTLRNAKFSTSMQSLGTPLLEDEQPLFDMLDSQPFTLTVGFINTDFSPNELIVSQVLGSILLNIPSLNNQTDGLLYVSTNLTSHSTTIQFNVSSSSAVGALRIGLTGPSQRNNNYFVQELNFSYAFNHTNRTVAQNPQITLQLIKLINETEPLSSDGVVQYSALWIPTFIKNDDQLFYTDSEFQLYHVNDETIFTVQITQATYYIYNKQEPITKVTEIIFTDILFTTMCIELFALTFLFFKLAIWPILKAIIGLCIKPKKVAPKEMAGVGCPYCRSVDPESLPAYLVPIQRGEQDTPRYPIRRQNWF